MEVAQVSKCFFKTHSKNRIHEYVFFSSLSPQKSGEGFLTNCSRLFLSLCTRDDDDDKMKAVVVVRGDGGLTLPSVL